VARVIWAPQAREDLNDIRRYIARNSQLYADVFLDRVLEAADRLEQFPRSGRIVPEAGQDDIRQVIVQSYRVIYRVRSDLVEILTVVHGARRLRDIPGV
jgi:addiction module RelE/StbE family toxin